MILDWVRIPTQLNTSKRGPKYLPREPRYQWTPISFNFSTKYLTGGPQMPPKSSLGTTLAPHGPPFDPQRPPHGTQNASKVVCGHQCGPPLDHPWAPRGKSDPKQWFPGRPFGPKLKDFCSRLRVFGEPKSHAERFWPCSKPRPAPLKKPSGRRPGDGTGDWRGLEARTGRLEAWTGRLEACNGRPAGRYKD